MNISKLRVTTTEVMGPQLSRLQTGAMAAGVIGLLLTAAGAILDLPQFFVSYLYAYLFWFGVTAGSLGFLLLHHTVGGGWGYIIRRFLEAAASVRLFLVMAVLFIPIIVPLFSGIPALYNAPGGWATPAAATDPIVGQKTAYLNMPFFIVRTAIYFAIWITFAYLVRKWGDTQDERADRQISAKLNYLGASGILIFVLVATFMSVDWVMSLTPAWFSSIIGLLFVAMEGLSTLSLMLLLLGFLAGRHPLMREVRPTFIRDLGNLLLATVMLWAYMSFSQYLITFSGNTWEEIPFYVQRANGGWGWVSLALIPFHFGLPFIILLTGSLGGNQLKDDVLKMRWVCLLIVVMRFVDLLWWIAPTFRPQWTIGAYTLSDLGAPLLLGGIWLYIWTQQVKDRYLVPIHDPRLEEAHAHEVVAHG